MIRALSFAGLLSAAYSQGGMDGDTDMPDGFFPDIAIPDFNDIDVEGLCKALDTLEPCIVKLDGVMGNSKCNILEPTSQSYAFLKATIPYFSTFLNATSSFKNAKDMCKDANPENGGRSLQDDYDEFDEDESGEGMEMPPFLIKDMCTKECRTTILDSVFGFLQCLDADKLAAVASVIPGEDFNTSMLDLPKMFDDEYKANLSGRMSLLCGKENETLCVDHMGTLMAMAESADGDEVCSHFKSAGCCIGNMISATDTENLVPEELAVLASQPMTQLEYFQGLLKEALEQCALEMPDHCVSDDDGEDGGDDGKDGGEDGGDDGKDGGEDGGDDGDELSGDAQTIPSFLTASVALVTLVFCF